MTQTRLLHMISGGHPGVELGALTAAATAGLTTGGFAAPGTNPARNGRYGLRPMAPPSSYSARMRANMTMSNATVVLTSDIASRRSLSVLRAGTALCQPVFFNPTVDFLDACVREFGWRTLHVTGDTARMDPLAADATHIFLSLVLTGEVPRG